MLYTFDVDNALPFNLTTAISATCEQCTGISITSIRIDGGRGFFGAIPDGDAMLELGSLAEVSLVEITEPRGKAAIRISAGESEECHSAEVANSDIVGWLEETLPETLEGDALRLWMDGEVSQLTDGVIIDDCPRSLVALLETMLALTERTARYGAI